MFIDDCRHSFKDLAESVLPDHMAKLRMSLQTPWPMSRFCVEKYGPSAIARELGVSGDFSGCYVMVEGDYPRYVGISRKVLDRLRQHVRGKTHFDASLAYSIAQRRRPTKGFRDSAMADPEFVEAFREGQAYLRSLHVGFVQIDNPLELYLFEAYAAMELGTSEWNTFRTH